MKVKMPKFTLEGLKRLKTSINLSDRQTKYNINMFYLKFIYLFRKVAAAFRVVTGRNSVESNLSSKLTQLNHEFDSFFYSKTVVMKVKPKKDQQEESDEEIDEKGYKDYGTVGVSFDITNLFLLNIDNIRCFVVIVMSLLKLSLNKGILILLRQMFTVD